MTATSAAAYEVAKPKIPSIKQRILDAVELAGEHGLQREELIRITGIRDNSLSGRITELKDEGKLRVNGTRLNARGNAEDVLKIGTGVPIQRAKKITLDAQRVVAVLLALGVTEDKVANTFVWSEQPEGFYFWHAIHDELLSAKQ